MEHWKFSREISTEKMAFVDPNISRQKLPQICSDDEKLFLLFSFSKRAQPNIQNGTADCFMENGSCARAYHPSIGYGIGTEQIHASKAPNGSERELEENRHAAKVHSLDLSYFFKIHRLQIICSLQR